MREKKDINIEIGANIQAARKKAAMTQACFAELVDLSTKNVSAIERGVAGVSLSALKRICEVLSISSDVILFGRSNHANDVQILCDRLQRLTPNQFDISNRILNILFESFTLNAKEEAVDS